MNKKLIIGISSFFVIFILFLVLTNEPKKENNLIDRISYVKNSKNYTYETVNIDSVDYIIFYQNGKIVQVIPKCNNSH